MPEEGTPEGTTGDGRPTDHDEESDDHVDAQEALRRGDAPVDESVGYAGQQADDE